MMKQVDLPTAVCSGMLIYLGMGVSASAAEPAVQGPPQQQLTDRLTDFTLQQIELPGDMPGEPFEATVALEGEQMRLKLHPHSLRAPDFRVLVSGPGGELVEAEAPPLTTFRGTVDGVPQSTVSGSLVDGKLTAYVELAPDSLYVIEPAPEPVHAAPGGPANHISYSVEDLGPSGYTCGVEIDELPQRPMPAGGGGADGTGLEIAEIAFDADAHFYIDNGSSVPATVNNIETVMNTAEFVYERDTDITYEITVVVVRAGFAEDPYTTSIPSDLLCQFRSVWNTTPESNIRRDTAQLFSGRSFTGTTIGLAYLGTVCNVTGMVAGCTGSGNLAYSIVETNFGGASFNERVALTAHEIGHNWNAGHCSGSSCHIMCGDLGGCGGISGPNLKFGPTAQSQIIAFRNSRTCLEDLPAPLIAPVLDEFPSTTIDPLNWIWYDPGVVAITDGGINEPSPPYSLRLRPFAAIQYRDGEIRSNVIDLEGESDLVLSYAVQSQNVEAGEQLFVEYFTENFTWTALNIISSPGIELDFYIEHEHDLPAAAHHDGFRLRFRSEGNEFDDEWYIDDVFIGPVVTVECPEDLDGDGSVGFADLLEVLSCWGPCTDCGADLDGDGTVGFSDLIQLLSAWGPCG